MAARTLGISLLMIPLLLGTMLPPALAMENLTIIASPQTGQLPLVVSFTASSLSPIEHYAWDFTSDGTIDSTEASPVFTYTSKGEYEVTLAATIAGQDAEATTTVTANEPNPEIKASVIASPTEGVAPLTVQFTVVAIGKVPLRYAWDTDMDAEPESYEQNPVVTFSTPGSRIVRVLVTDADGNTAKEEISINVVEYDSKLRLSMYFPAMLTVGENNVTLIMSNMGEEEVNEVTAKIVGANVHHLSSTSIPALKPGDQDSVTVRLSVLQEGELNATAKVLDKNFPLLFNVTMREEANKSAIQARLDKTKEQFKQQEAVYYDKKAQGYVVADFLELKVIQDQLQDAQENILKGDLEDARIGIDLLTIAIDDFTESVSQAKKPVMTPLQWMKENALAITAIIAALGTLSGILLKLKHHAVKMRNSAKRLVEKTAKKKQPAKKRKTKKKEKEWKEKTMKEPTKNQDDAAQAGASEKGQA